MGLESPKNDKRLISDCSGHPNEADAQHRWYPMSLGIYQQPHDKQTARPTKSLTEV